MTGSTITVSGVHHVSFRVDDLDAAVAFYGGVLGCERIDRPDLGFRGAWMRAGRTEVHLIEAPADERTGFPPASSPNYGIANHVAFEVDNLDDVGARLRHLGLTVEVGAVLRQLFVQDPSGNVIELAPIGGGRS